jgi:hypothetical protein
MNVKTMLGFAVAALIGIGAAAWLSVNPPPEPVVVANPATPPPKPAAPLTIAPTPPPPAPVVAATPAVPEAKPAPVAKKPKVVSASGQPPAPADPPTTDTAARAALSLVGVDREAEKYWTAAINDPNLPAGERKNLIEDLNEDGLSDPKNPGPQDLPIILSRMRLIEKLAPSAMDQVNADAFAEAYKDLVKMAHGQKPD